MATDVSPLREILEREHPTIVERWLEAILATYPEDSARFLKNQRDQFANPVGTTLSRELHSVFDELVRGETAESTREFLDRIIRIRAVQDFSPAAALAFVFDLKQIVRELIMDEVREKGLLDELARFEARIDEMGLLAFNVYMECREKLYELRVQEVKKGAYLLLKKAEMIVDTPSGESEPVM